MSITYSITECNFHPKSFATRLKPRVGRINSLSMSRNPIEDPHRGVEHLAEDFGGRGMIDAEEEKLHDNSMYYVCKYESGKKWKHSTERVCGLGHV